MSWKVGVEHILVSRIPVSNNSLHWAHSLNQPQNLEREKSQQHFQLSESVAQADRLKLALHKKGQEVCARKSRSIHPGASQSRTPRRTRLRKWQHVDAIVPLRWLGYRVRFAVSSSTSTTNIARKRLSLRGLETIFRLSLGARRLQVQAASA